MNIKQSLLVLIAAGFCVTHAQDDTKTAVAKVVGGGVVGAVAVTAAEDTIKKHRHLRYWTRNGMLHIPYVQDTLPMHGAGPARDMNTMLISYNTQSLHVKEYKQIDEITAALKDSDYARFRPLYQLRLQEKSQRSYLRDELPKTLRRYAFYRNLAIIWGAMHLYDMYKATKNKR